MVERIARDGVKAAAARRAFKGDLTPPRTAFDQRLQGLLTGWERSGMAVRQAFVDHVLDDLAPIVSEALAARGGDGQ